MFKVLFSSKKFKDINVLVVGLIGYIGNFVVKELILSGFNVIVVVSESSGMSGKNSKEEVLGLLNGVNVCFLDVMMLEFLEKSVGNFGVLIDVVVFCFVSSSGGVKDLWKMDYEVMSNSFIVGSMFGVVYFVLLFVICV